MKRPVVVLHRELIDQILAEVLADVARGDAARAGRKLRAARDGVSLRQCDIPGWSRKKVGRVERGLRLPTPDEVRSLLSVYHGAPVDPVPEATR
ncbi:MAG: hypothetical protein J2P26_10210 [Nocardiopsaceae bacterium]|nr:hypothetical protein [Nocardiopsaceae bacterium]